MTYTSSDSLTNEVGRIWWWFSYYNISSGREI